MMQLLLKSSTLLWGYIVCLIYNCSNITIKVQDLVSEVLVNIGPGAPDDNKPLPEPMWTKHERIPYGKTWGQFHWNVLKKALAKMCDNYNFRRLSMPRSDQWVNVQDKITSIWWMLWQKSFSASNGICGTIWHHQKARVVVLDLFCKTGTKHCFLLATRVCTAFFIFKCMTITIKHQVFLHRFYLKCKLLFCEMGFRSMLYCNAVLLCICKDEGNSYVLSDIIIAVS